MKEAAIRRINMKYLSSVAGFRAEISNQRLHQKAPIGNKCYKAINTQRTTCTIMVVPPTTFTPATDSRNCQTAFRYLPFFVLKATQHARENARKALADYTCSDSLFT